MKEGYYLVKSKDEDKFSYKFEMKLNTNLPYIVKIRQNYIKEDGWVFRNMSGVSDRYLDYISGSDLSWLEKHTVPLENVYWRTPSSISEKLKIIPAPIEVKTIHYYKDNRDVMKISWKKLYYSLRFGGHYEG